MTDTTTLRALEARLESATGAFEKIPDEIHNALGSPCCLCPNAPARDRDEARHLFLRALRGSIDAAVELIEKVLPDWRVTHAYWNSVRAHFTLAKDRAFVDGDAPTPALALCLATVRALIARAEGGE